MYDCDYVRETLEQFGYTCDESTTLLDRISSLGTQLSLAEEDFADEIIAFAAQTKKTDVTMTFLDTFEQERSKKAAKKQAEHNTPIRENVTKPRIVLGERPILGEFDADTSTMDFDQSFIGETTEVTGHYSTFAPVQCTPGHANFMTRTDSGKVMASTEGPTYVESSLPTTGKAEVEILSEEADKYYGGDKTASVIDLKFDRLAQFADLLNEANPNVPHWTRKAVSSASVIYMYGEIVFEGADIVRLSDSLVHLMLDDEDGTVLSVDLSELPNVSMFPGQLVAFRGVNETGKCLIAKEQIFPKEMKAAPYEAVHSLTSLRVWAACGPFTSTETCSYEPLCDLLNLVKKEEPHALILMGPFVDRRNKFMMNSSFQQTQRDVMKKLLENIAKALDGVRTELILQPSSTRDATSNGVFPCPPLDLPNHAIKTLGKKVHVVSDPAVVNIAGINVAISNSEIVSHLSKMECHRSADQENSDRIARLSGHLLQQRSLYPLSPALLPSSSDVLRCSRLLTAPHLMICPSSLLPTYIKIQNGTTICNPGSLVSGNPGRNPGSFMRSEINVGMLAPDAPVHEVSQFSVVKI